MSKYSNGKRSPGSKREKVLRKRIDTYHSMNDGSAGGTAAQRSLKNMGTLSTRLAKRYKRSKR